MLRSPSTGEEHRLHALFREPAHHLLLLPPDGDPVPEMAEIARLTESTYPGAIRSHLIATGESPPSSGDGRAPDWLDPKGDLRRLLGARNTGPTDASNAALALVRPDGYLGYRGQPASWDDLRGYLDRYLIAVAG
jgi:hypothetical protein